jgi:hypothetical protein
VNEGVYTAEQAKRGEALYKENCSACHGDNLEGSGPMPPLAGKDFLANWQGKTVGDLFEKTSTTMPATAPGSLTPEQAADIISFLLSKDAYPAGSAALEAKTEPLLKIKIDAPNKFSARHVLGSSTVRRHVRHGPFDIDDGVARCRRGLPHGRSRILRPASDPDASAAETDSAGAFQIRFLHDPGHLDHVPFALLDLVQDFPRSGQTEAAADGDFIARAIGLWTRGDDKRAAFRTPGIETRNESFGTFFSCADTLMTAANIKTGIAYFMGPV